MKGKSLSLKAKNAKIIMVQGRFILLGPVNTAEEKTEVSDPAKAATGQISVDDPLEVKTNK